MTLIAALICNNCVLIGCDSKAADDLGTYKQEKLWQLFNETLVCGGSGDGRIIDDICNWIKDQESFEKLDTHIQKDKSVIQGMWVAKISHQLVTLNGRNMGLMKLSETHQSNESMVTGELLVAGFLKDSPFLLTINRQGMASYDTKHGFTASGSECYRFVGAIQALMPDNFQQLTQKEQIVIFANALDASIKNSDKADFPVQMWIVYPNHAPEQILNLDDGDKPTLDRLKNFLTTPPPSN